MQATPCEKTYIASTSILVEVMTAGQSSYRNSLTIYLTTKTAQYFSHGWNDDFPRGKGRGRYADKSKLLLAGLEPKTLLNSLFRLHLIITSNYRGKNVSITTTAQNCCVRHVHTVIE